MQHVNTTRVPIQQKWTCRAPRHRAGRCFSLSVACRGDARRGAVRSWSLPVPELETFSNAVHGVCAVARGARDFPRTHAGKLRLGLVRGAPHALVNGAGNLPLVVSAAHGEPVLVVGGPAFTRSREFRSA